MRIREFLHLLPPYLLASGLAIFGISSALAADWPRQITDSRGPHTLESQPLRIVSTSVTLTGSLLAIDAPVVASGATTPNRVADGQGFLRQWSDVAKARKLSRSILANRALRPSRRKCRIHSD
jgi:iron complex transport system substrate-binding protein